MKSLCCTGYFLCFGFILASVLLYVACICRKTKTVLTRTSACFRVIKNSSLGVWYPKNMLARTLVLEVLHSNHSLLLCVFELVISWITCTYECFVLKNPVIGVFREAGGGGYPGGHPDHWRLQEGDGTVVCYALLCRRGSADCGSSTRSVPLCSLAASIDLFLHRLHLLYTEHPHNIYGVLPL